MSRRVVPWVLLFAHVGVTAWLAAAYQRSDNPWLLLAVSALPLAQTSLLAAWGVWGRWPSYVRAPMVAIAVTALWAVECHALNLELADTRCAAYALTFVVQTMVVSGLLATMRLGRWLIVRRRAREKHEWRVQFGSGLLFGWVAAIALILGVWKSLLIRADWPLGVVKTEFFLFGGGVGAYSAAFAVIVLACVWWKRLRNHVLAQAVVALGLACAVATSQSVVLRTCFGIDGRVDSQAWVIQAGFQALYLLVTLVPIGLCETNQLKEPIHGTSTGLTTRRAGIPNPA